MDDSRRDGHECRERTFAQMAEQLGFRPRMFYKLADVQTITGISSQKLRTECLAGRMRYTQPGETYGKYWVRPEWVDEWIEGCSHGLVA